MLQPYLPQALLAPRNKVVPQKVPWVPYVGPPYVTRRTIEAVQRHQGAVSVTSKTVSHVKELQV